MVGRLAIGVHVTMGQDPKWVAIQLEVGHGLLMRRTPLTDALKLSFGVQRGKRFQEPLD